MKLKFVIAVATLSFLLRLSQAGVTTETAPLPQASPFAAGSSEIDFGGGWFHSPVFTYGHRPILNWIEGDLSWGLMLNSPCGPGYFRGNWEFLVNGFGAAVTRGPGGCMGGGRALFRYNFVQPQCSLVPFIQLGGGSVLDDAYRDHVQHMIGGEFEFSVVGDIGLRYFVSNHWAVVAMADFQHISNAGIYSRNQGANGLGANVGAGYFF